MRRICSLLLSIIVLFSFLSFYGCTKEKEPWTYPNVQWQSDTPVMCFITKYAGEPSIGYIELNGERKDVYLTWGPPTYMATIREYNSSNGINIGTDKVLLKGEVEYDKSSATIIIKIDNCFNGKYDKIQLIRSDV